MPNFKHLNSTKFPKIAVQINFFGDYKNNAIINKIYNIPIKYDLFIFTNLSEKVKLIENNIKKKYSNYNKYYIIMVENNFINDKNIYIILKIIVKNYKYICNINNINFIYINKKHEYMSNNLYDNIIENNDSVLDVVSNFETYKELGFIFSEINTNIFSEILVNDNKDFINNFLDKIFPGENHKIGKENKLIIGNIFWGKIEANYQIFNAKIYKEFLLIKNKELIFKNIDIILLYLVKINGFCYKRILQY